MRYRIRELEPFLGTQFFVAEYWREEDQDWKRVHHSQRDTSEIAAQLRCEKHARRQKEQREYAEKVKLGTDVVKEFLL